MNLSEEGLLVEAVKAGSIQGFEELVDRYKDRVYNLTRHLADSPQEAEDLAQDTFLLIYQNIKGFQGSSSLSTWIYRITLNRCLDWQRRQKQKRKYLLPFLHRKEDDETDPLERLPSHLPSPEEEVVANEQVRQIRKAIQDLPEKYRNVMILYYYQQMSYAEIGQVLEIPVRTVETRLYRGKQRIRETLTDCLEKGVTTHGFTRNRTLDEENTVSGS